MEENLILRSIMMKMRNMLRGVLFLLLMASGLGVFLSCKGISTTSTAYTVTFDAQGGSPVAPLEVEHGKTIAKPADPAKGSFAFNGWYKESTCTTPWNFATDTVTADITLFAKWTPVAPATVTVTFAVKDGHGTLTAKADGKNLTSGDKIKKDTDVTFIADPETGYEVDYVLINNEEQRAGTEITVKADKDVTVTVKFKAQGAPATELFTVTYKAEPTVGGAVSAKVVNGTSFKSGKKIEKGTVLEFIAVPNTGYNISSWTGVTPESDNKSAKLTVTGDSSVTVMFTLKKYTVTFDAQGGSPVASIKAEQGKTIAKPADPAKGSFAFDGWYKESTCTTPWNFATDTVTADITLFAKWKITIQFDASKMKCIKDGGHTINTGDIVYENDQLYFESTPPKGKIVEKWTVNGSEPPASSVNLWGFNYTVKAENVQSGVIDIDYTVKTATRATIHFDPSKMTCRKGGRYTINSGDTVYENDNLSFTATLPTGQTVEKWKINSHEPPPTWSVNPCIFDYTVKAEDVQSDVIDIDYTVKTATPAIIHFDPSKIECEKGSTTVNTGDVVYENDALSFMAINLPAGQTVKSWTVNGSEPTGALPWIFHYTVRTDDIKSGTITVAYTEKTAAEATIHFDSSKIKCFRFFGSDTTPDIPIADGGTVYEHDNLMCIAKLPAGKMVDSWTVNGTDRLMKLGNSGFYRVDKEDSDLRFDYTEKIAERLELKFDSSKIRCTKLYDKTPIAPGQRDEGDVLIFRTVDGSAVLWKVNGNNIPGRRSYYMQEEYGNENVLEISYE